MILRFFAVDGLDSYSPVRARMNKIEPLGKVLSKEGKWVVDHAQAARVVLGGDEAHDDRMFLRKEVLRGHILPAVEETARQLDVPWKPEAVAGRVVDAPEPTPEPPPPAPAPAEDAPARPADTLPPPAFEPPALTPAAPVKRKEK